MVPAALLASLLEAQPFERASLSVIVANPTARAFYERRGWQCLHQSLVFASAPQKTCAILVRELARPATPRPNDQRR